MVKILESYHVYVIWPIVVFFHPCVSWCIFFILDFDDSNNLKSNFALLTLIKMHILTKVKYIHEKRCASKFAQDKLLNHLCLNYY